jgi:multiple RNA-binding domain-containing protein 1
VVTGDPSKPKAWSRYAPDSTAYKKEHEGFKDSKIHAEKKKSEKGKKKDSKMQELIDKVLRLHLDTQDLYF